MNQNSSERQTTFEEALLQQAAEKQREYSQLVHEAKRVTLRLEKCKAYVQQLNSLLVAHNLSPIQLHELTPKGGVGKPGNRSKDMPVRRAEWEGMSLTQIVSSILGETDEVMHANALVERIYEIDNDRDRLRAKHSLVGTLRAGARNELWEGLPRNKYHRKTSKAEAQRSYLSQTPGQTARLG
ncbi:MAG: hypothetical protein Q7T26_05710 [Dehalococcoidia bacterium]|nr:hypothetical protein [Dehalococcoidia bacterium]